MITHANLAVQGAVCQTVIGNVRTSMNLKEKKKKKEKKKQFCHSFRFCNVLLKSIPDTPGPMLEQTLNGRPVITGYHKY